MALPRSLERIAIGSIVVALAGMGLKYAAYAVTGSAALFSDAVESIINLVTAIIVLVTIKISHKPADRRHQFGHHKAEYIAAVLEGVLIVLAAVMICREAIETLMAPREISAPWKGLFFSGIAFALNAGWATFLITSGRARKSPALEADGWHIMSDVITTIGVIIGVGATVLTGFLKLDPIIAIGVAASVLWAGWRLMRNSVSGLMDEAVTTDVAARIRNAISAHGEGAIEVHDLRTRSAGRAIFVEFHLVVPGRMSVAEAHEICDRIETAIMDEIGGTEVLIHVEPEGEAQHKGLLVL
jgi:cation diffusion facilitator family transporter